MREAGGSLCLWSNPTASGLWEVSEEDAPGALSLPMAVICAWLAPMAAPFCFPPPSDAVYPTSFLSSFGNSAMLPVE